MLDVKDFPLSLSTSTLSRTLRGALNEMNTDNDVQPRQDWVSGEIERQDCITRSRYWQSVFVRLPCNLETGHTPQHSHWVVMVMVHRNRTITESLKRHSRKQSSSARNFTKPSFLTHSHSLVITLFRVVLYLYCNGPSDIRPWLNLSQHNNHNFHNLNNNGNNYGIDYNMQ